jgi:hypothetical protein
VFALGNGESSGDDRGTRVERGAFVNIVELKDVRGDTVGERGAGCGGAAFRKYASFRRCAQPGDDFPGYSGWWFEAACEGGPEPVEDGAACVIDD